MIKWNETEDRYYFDFVQAITSSSLSPAYFKIKYSSLVVDEDTYRGIKHLISKTLGITTVNGIYTVECPPKNPGKNVVHLRDGK